MAEQWRPFVRVKTTEAGSYGPTEIVVSGITTGTEKRVILKDALRVSVGKTRSASSSDGEVLVTFDSTTTKGQVTTSGTGRVEPVQFSKLPKLKVNTKKQSRAEKYGLYAQIRLKQETTEIVDGTVVEYFDLVFGRKDMERGALPHFGFRPTGSSHFYVKTEVLGVSHKSYGEIMCNSAIVIPKKIVVSLDKLDRKIIITFCFNAHVNELLADTIEIQ